MCILEFTQWCFKSTLSGVATIIVLGIVASTIVEIVKAFTKD